MALIYKRLAMFLLQYGFVLFLALDPMIVGGSKKPTDPFMTTKPKDKEIFVGDTVVFDWDYRKEEPIESVRFGIVSNGPRNEGTKDVTILVKRPNDVVYLNTGAPEVKELTNRVEFVQNRRASFRMRNVRMNDTGIYFCTLEKKGELKTFTDKVNLRVVDLQIDDTASTSVEDSWKKQKTTLLCAVRVVKGQPVTFTWWRQPDNQTLSRGKHIDTRTESILTIITTEDYHFTTYTCVAKTKQTTKLHNIVVRRLYGPGPPLNLQQQYIFDRVKGDSYHKIYWSPPKTDGGAKVTDYIIEYKPRGISWAKATKAITKNTVYKKFNLKEGKLYDVRVMARNKVDEGNYSNEVEIRIPGGYPSLSARSNSSTVKHQATCWSCMISLLSILFLQLYSW